MTLTSSDAPGCQDNAWLTIRCQASDPFTLVLPLLFFIGVLCLFSFYFSVHVYTLSLSPLRSGGELFRTSGKLRPGIVHYNQRFPGRVVRGTLSIIARAHEGFVQSVKTISLYRSDIFRQTKISFPFYLLLCGA